MHVHFLNKLQYISNIWIDGISLNEDRAIEDTGKGGHLLRIEYNFLSCYIIIKVPYLSNHIFQNRASPPLSCSSIIVIKGAYSPSPLFSRKPIMHLSPRAKRRQNVSGVMAARRRGWITDIRPGSIQHSGRVFVTILSVSGVLIFSPSSPSLLPRGDRQGDKKERTERGRRFRDFGESVRRRRNVRGISSRFYKVERKTRINAIP